LKIQTKFAIYGALIKAFIILGIGIILPIIVEKVVYIHMDKRLQARTERVLKIIEKGGIKEIIMEQDCSFDSYNLLKEEFIAIRPLANKSEEPGITFHNEEWFIGGDYLNHRIARRSFYYDHQLYEINIGEGLAALNELNATISKFTFLMLLVVVLISVFLDIAFVRILLRPFYRIVEKKIRQPKEPAFFDFTRIKTSTFEFSELDQSINDLMKKINDAFLIEKEFIANVSHELLTPISILQSRFENILGSGDVSNDVAIKIVDSQKILTRLSKIIKTLLLISKIENNQYLREDTILIKNILEDVCDEIEERMVSKGIVLKYALESDFDFHNCNHELMHTLFFNIINNAIKYNKEGGCILLKGYWKDSHYNLDIIDNGIGIEAQYIETIFSRFKKLNHKHVDSYGLGLPIVKTIADFHRIEIKLFSKPNEGMTFRLIFP